MESVMMIDLRPICSFDAKHGADAPSRAEHIEGFREAVIVNDSSVDWEDSHQEYDVATGKHHVKYLQRGKKKTRLFGICSALDLFFLTTGWT